MEQWRKDARKEPVIIDIDTLVPQEHLLRKIEKEEVSLEEKLDFVEIYAKEHGTFSFRKMLEGQKSKMEIVVTFLAILELMKMGKIVIRQENAFDDIVISSAQYYRKDV